MILLGASYSRRGTSNGCVGADCSDAEANLICALRHGPDTEITAPGARSGWPFNAGNCRCAPFPQHAPLGPPGFAGERSGTCHQARPGPKLGAAQQCVYYDTGGGLAHFFFCEVRRRRLFFVRSPQATRFFVSLICDVYLK